MTRLLSTVELAEALGVNPETIRRKRAIRAIPYHDIDGMYRYDLDAVKAASLVPTAAAVAQERFEKLLGWMGSNVPEGWREVENTAAILVYAGWDAAEKYLDDLPHCAVGLMTPAGVNA